MEAYFSDISSNDWDLNSGILPLIVKLYFLYLYTYISLFPYSIKHARENNAYGMKT